MNKAYILNIGDEILLGQIVNTNASWMSERLAELGLQVVEQRVIGDESEQILDAVQDAHRFADLLLITGGLGPTKDDITKKVLADFFDTELRFDEALYKHLEQYFRKLGRTPTEAHKEQCKMPEEAEQWENSMGTAPGMYFRKGNTHTLSMPGVPYEMKYIFNKHLVPFIQSKRNQALIHETILTIGKGESKISEMIEDIEDALPSHIKLAYLPNLARVRLRLTAIGNDAQSLKEEVYYWKDKLVNRLGRLVYGYNKQTLSAVLQSLAIEKGAYIATAESCTGGRIAQEITSEPGSSQYFLGSVIAYDNQVKKNILGVSQQTLEDNGAVSEETVKEMVLGACKLLKADIAVATSGIAGPEGGTSEKPVGTIWIAVGNADRMISKKLQLSKNRVLNIEYTSMIALNLMRRFLMDL